MEDKHYAVLIDSDNVSAKYIAAILDEMTKYGVVTYKRIYGDWTSNQASKWREELLGHSITPIQQFSNTVGKNATDSALIIDAMDILYTGHLDGFCLVSSDGDFTRLATRLRESGMDVIGMGETKTPKSFKAACSIFTNLEILLETGNEDEVKENISSKKIEEAIAELVLANENSGRKTGLGEVGSSLVKKYSDFDVRNYGYSSLSKFLEEMDSFVLTKIENSYYVSLKQNALPMEDLQKFIVNEVKSCASKGIDLGLLGQHLHNRYPNFKVQEYGYSSWQKLVSSIVGLLIVTQGNTKRVHINDKTEPASAVTEKRSHGTSKKGKK
ncbi:MAG: NYN domain-containing protein [Lachnospiraceae bacterium]